MQQEGVIVMAGHNKWSQIKHKKAKEDSKKGKAFTRLTKEITMTVRMHGGDPAHNAHLRLLLEKAREINMPQENSIRAIKRGTGELPGMSYEAITYEGYGPEGIAIIVDALTDNKNRTVADMRRVFSSNGGRLAETGSVNWMFEKKGVINGTIGDISEDGILEQLIGEDITVDDVQRDDTFISIICDPRDLMKAKHLAENLHISIEDASISWVAKGKITLPEESAQKAYELLEELDNHDDVQNVYTNLA